MAEKAPPRMCDNYPRCTGTLAAYQIGGSELCSECADKVHAARRQTRAQIEGVAQAEGPLAAALLAEEVGRD